MRLQSPTHPALYRLVDLLWVGTPAPIALVAERILPTGQAHLAFRRGAPIRIGLQRFEHGVIGGPRSSAHLHDHSPVRSIGALLSPGAVRRIFGVPAHELAEHHHGLDDVSGGFAPTLQDRLDHADDDAALAILPAALVTRLTPAARPPALARASRCSKPDTRSPPQPKPSARARGCSIFGLTMPSGFRPSAGPAFAVSSVS